MRFALLEAKVALLAVCRRFVFLVCVAIVLFIYKVVFFQIHLPTWDEDEGAPEAGPQQPAWVA